MKAPSKPRILPPAGNAEIVHRPRKRSTASELKYNIEDHLRQLSAITMFAATGADAVKNRIKQGQEDPFFFYATYFPHITTNEPADWHPEFVDDLQQTDEMLAITAERGGAKSMLLFMEVIRWICYRYHKLIVYRLDTFEKAELYTERILIEFQHNQRLRHDFGVMVSPDTAHGDFSCYDPETKRTITRVLAYGSSMSLRGLINEDTRPDVIINEDLQDRESAESEKRTEKELRRLLRDARPALTPTGWKFIVVGNIICSGSLMDILLNPEKHKAFIKRRYPAEYRDEFGVRHSTWEARFPITLLDKIREDIGDDAYEVEFLCKAVEVGTVFKAKRDIHHYRELPKELNLEDAILVQIDPALSGLNDYTAIGVFVSYTHDRDRSDYNQWADENGVVFGEGIYTIMLEGYCRQVGIDEGIEASCDLFLKWKATDFHCDGSVDKEIILGRFYDEYEARTGIRLPIQFDKFDTSKESRIKALQPLMKRRKILFPPSASEDVQTMVKQFTRFGKANEHDDAPDMVAAAAENIRPDYGYGTVEVTIL